VAAKRGALSFGALFVGVRAARSIFDRLSHLLTMTHRQARNSIARVAADDGKSLLA
jgi:hypothetical protein